MYTRKALKTAVTLLAVVVFTGTGTLSVSADNLLAVNYRLTQWNAAHFDDAISADAFYVTVKRLGCQVEKGSHGGHYDVKYLCPQWQVITFTTHDETHQWEAWLKANGFETKHSH